MTEDRWIGSSTPYVTRGEGDVWGNAAAKQGHKGTQQILRAGIQAAPSAVAELLCIPASTAVVCRQRLVSLDSQPIEFAQSYWPADVAEGTALSETKKIPGGVVTLLHRLGYHPGTIDEDVQARPPTVEEQKALRLTDASDWVLTLTRTISTPDGHPYEVSVMVSPGRIGRHHYSMKVD